MVELFLELPAFVPLEYTGDQKELQDPLLEFVGKYKESFPYYWSKFNYAGIKLTLLSFRLMLIWD